MATRTISTRIAIEGEDEFKRKVSSINSSLGVLKSELSKTKAEFNGNANSMDALRSKAELLNKIQAEQKEKVSAVEAALQNAKEAQQRYAATVEECRAKVEGAKAALANLASTSGASKQAQDQLTASLEKYEKELEDAERYNEAAQRGVNGWQKQVNSAQRDLKKLNADINANDKYMGEAKRSADGCATSIDGYGKKVKSAGQETKETNAAVSALAAALVAGGLKVAFDKVVDTVQACIGAFIEYESAVTGVQKTVDGTEEQLAAISDGIRKMALEIPSSTTEIAAVAEAAGQLGIATDDVLDFTRVMIDLGQSTNLSAEQAATALAKFANITGMSSNDYERLGSVIVDLGNHFATTEADIVEMATRLASTGTLTGLTEAQIMALSTALSSVGIEAEAGGSALSKLLKEFEVMVETGSSDLEDFAGVAGMTSAEFSRAWRQDAVAALSAFLKGLGGIDASGGSAVATLEKLGITETRMSNATLALASSGDLLTNAVNTANAAWEANTALAEEAGKRYGTTESQIAVMKNAFNELKITVGEALAPAIKSAVGAGTEMLEWAADLVEKCPWVVSLISAVAAGIGALTAALVGYHVAVEVILPLLRTFNDVLKDNPAGMAAVAIGVLITAIGAFIITSQKASDATENYNRKLKETVSATDGAVESIQKDTAERLANLEAVKRLLPEINELNSKSSRTAEEQNRLNALVETANKLYPGFIGEVDSLTDSYNINAGAIYENIEALKAQIQMEANRDIAKEKYQAAAKLRSDLADAEDELTKAQEAQRAEEEEFYDLLEAGFVTMENYETWMVGVNTTVADAEKATAKLTNQISEYETEADAAIGVVSSLAGENKKLGDSLGDAAGAADDAATRLSVLAGMLDKTKGSFELLSKAEGEMADTGYLTLDTVKTMLEKYPELSGYLLEVEGGYRLTDGALQAYLTTQQAEYQLTFDNAENAAQKIIDNQIRVRGAVIDTTLSVEEQLTALMALYNAEAINASLETNGAQAAQDTLQWRAYEKLQETYDQYMRAKEERENAGRIFDSLQREGASGAGKGGGSKSSRKEPTQAELDLEAYKAAVKELDHQRAMEEITEEEYYRRKGSFAELYLKENLEQYQKWEEELFAYQKGTYDRELKDLDQSLENKAITTEEHLAGLRDLQARYLAEGTDEWYENQRQQTEDMKSLYADKQATQKYLLDMDIISEEQYYAELERLRDEYLEEDSEAWRSATVSINKYRQEQRDKAIKAVQEAGEAARKAQEAEEKKRAELVKQYTQERIVAIKAEQKAEEERVNALIDGINDEIAARKRLRQEESDEDAVAKARKTLEAAQAQLAFARDENTRAELAKEVARAQAAYDKALQAKEDNDWEYAKKQEIEALKDQLEAAKREYQKQIDEAPQWAEEKMQMEEEARAAANAARAQKEADELERMLEEMRGVQKTASGAVAAAAQAAAQVTNLSKSIYSTTNHNSVSVTTAAAPITSGQMYRAVEKALDKLSR